MLSETNELAVLRAIGIGCKFWGLSRLGKADVDEGGDGFCDAVDLAVTLPKHSPNVADRGARRHRAEGNDLGNAVFPVLLRDVANHLVTATIFKVDVNIGHGHAVLVQESLERKFVMQRVYGRDAERVGHD